MEVAFEFLKRSDAERKRQLVLGQVGARRHLAENLNQKSLRAKMPTAFRNVFQV